jgi:hypothetical protein
VYCNARVTFDGDPRNDRSESSLAANPVNPNNMVGSSKKFFDPTIYAFTLAAYYTLNGGRSWNEAPALELLANWAGTSDPAVACDNMGNAFLVALPFSPGTPTDFTGPVIGIAVYKSSDGGQSWSPPNLIHASAGDDKQWAAADNSPASPYQGNVYAVWDNGSQLAFARTLDHGASWAGVGAQSVGSPLAFDSFAPDISVAADGTVFIVWVAGSAIKFVKSTDGGNSFSAPAVAVSGITPVPGQLPGGKFRVFTLPAGCAGTGGTVVFAWADMREGVSRIYYCFSNDSGTMWQGGPSGQPLLPGWLASRSNQHDFHPQLVTTPDGRIGCAFYEFGPKWWWWWWWPWPPWGPLLIDVVLSISTDNGATFASRETVTSQPWDPTIDAPFAHGSPNVTFIGDYFGLAGSSIGFFPFWTDTRTGMQEIFAGYQPPWWCLWCWFFCWFWGWSWGWRSWFVHARVWWRRRAYRRRQRRM